MILGPSPGESWLEYVGVPDTYPGFTALAREVDDAMWEAAQDVLRERRAEDPLLRVLSDDRAGLWDRVRCPAGDLPPGTWITVDESSSHRGSRMVARGETRPLNAYEIEKAAHMPLSYADLVGVDWHGYTGDWTGAWPHVVRSTEVTASLPIPFDLSALLTIIDAENGTPPAPVRPPARAAASRRRRKASTR